MHYSYNYNFKIDISGLIYIDQNEPDALSFKVSRTPVDKGFDNSPSSFDRVDT